MKETIIHAVEVVGYAALAASAAEAATVIGTGTPADLGSEGWWLHAAAAVGAAAVVAARKALGKLLESDGE